MLKEERPKFYSATLALLIHGIIHFPNMDKFVDHLAVEVFLTKNLVPFLLVDLYHTFNTRHEKKGGAFLCCAPLLHLWMRDCMPQYGLFTQSNLTWPQKFSSLSASSILWYKREWGMKDVIARCRGFPNIPLIRMQGCINYNPAILKRQLGYSIFSPPEEKDFIPFIVSTVDPLDSNVKKMRKARPNIVRIDQEWGKKNILAKEPYFVWVKERARVVKMRFLFDPSSFPLMPKLEPILQEDMDKLTNQIKELELENTQLRVQLNRAKECNHVLEDKGKQVCENLRIARRGSQ
ncbi:uncharacterized protein LOC127130768 [Lathyrus oleraceus]|uniref:uncharacterized protein LOC127130768 n=1 Tax=Pisum sativum TaxID=3888 RepID=UPI0021D1C6AD|nr:uncharacterized protein LOC127130768 [Pisum sativum]